MTSFVFLICGAIYMLFSFIRIYVGTAGGSDRACMIAILFFIAAGIWR